MLYGLVTNESQVSQIQKNTTIWIWRKANTTLNLLYCILRLVMGGAT
jgi:hypothetical protein